MSDISRDEMNKKVGHFMKGLGNEIIEHLEHKFLEMKKSNPDKLGPLVNYTDLVLTQKVKVRRRHGLGQVNSYWWQIIWNTKKHFQWAQNVYKKYTGKALVFELEIDFNGASQKWEIKYLVPHFKEKDPQHLANKVLSALIHTELREGGFFNTVAAKLHSIDATHQSVIEELREEKQLREAWLKDNKVANQ